MPTSYDKYRRLNPRGPIPFQPYGTSNLPSYTGSGAFQGEPATVGDLYKTGGKGGNANPWAAQWRRAAGLQYQNILQGGEEDVGRQLSSMGLQFSSPAWKTSLMNPYYQQANQYMAGENAMIGRTEAQMEQQRWLAKMQADLMRQLNEKRYDWLGLGADVAQSIPFWSMAFGKGGGGTV